AQAQSQAACEQGIDLLNERREYRRAHVEKEKIAKSQAQKDYEHALESVRVVETLVNKSRERLQIAHALNIARHEAIMNHKGMIHVPLGRTYANAAEWQEMEKDLRNKMEHAREE